jgi:hypothetical protein
MGFGHRVYKNFDPRAKIIKRMAEEVFEVTGRNPLLDIALELERIALQDDYFVKRKLYPNVDFYSGLIYQAIGLPTAAFTVLFAIPRTSGWLSQWEELLEDPEEKIARPRQVYLGEGERAFQPLEKVDRKARGAPKDRRKAPVSGRGRPPPLRGPGRGRDCAARESREVVGQRGPGAHRPRAGGLRGKARRAADEGEADDRGVLARDRRGVRRALGEALGGAAGNGSRHARPDPRAFSALSPADWHRRLHAD